MGPTRPRSVTTKLRKLFWSGTVRANSPKLPLIVLFPGGRQEYERLGIRRPGQVGVAAFAAVSDVDLRSGALSIDGANESLLCGGGDGRLYPGDVRSIRRKG